MKDLIISTIFCYLRFLFNIFQYIIILITYLRQLYTHDIRTDFDFIEG